MVKAIFLDRDGVINQDVNYLSSPTLLDLIPGTKEALNLFKEHGYKIIVITNQSGIARGYFTDETLNKIHTRLDEMVDFAIDYFFYCPHHPSKDCDCRKPKPTMILKAAKLFNINLMESYMIGDKKTDILCGKNANCKTIAVQTGYGETEDADYVCKNLLDAARNIICKH